MSVLVRMGLCLLVVGGVLIDMASPCLAAEEIVVSGVVWYDDNQNGAIDPDEELAPQVAVAVMVGIWGPHGHQPNPVAIAPSDDTGHFQAVFKPGTVRPVSLTTLGGVLRPGYPYYRWPTPSGPTAVNYTTNLIPVPLDSGERVTVNLPLIPLPGVLARLPQGAPPDFPIPDGHFFTQTNGLSGRSAFGFPVTNADGVPFWDTWFNLGLENVGYPISDRFMWAGFLTQVFQKAVFQWHPGKGVFLVNIFDEFHSRETLSDLSLREHHATPLPLDPIFDAGKSWEQIVRDRLALLDASPAIRSRYFAAPDPLLLFGLPTSYVEDFGDVVVIRTQRTVLQLWKEAVPFAAAGEVTIANGGEIAKELAVFGWYDLDVFKPRPPQ